MIFQNRGRGRGGNGAYISLASHLHDLILELGQEVVDNLKLLDGQRMQVDLLHAVDLAGLDQTAKLGHGLPLLLLALAASSSTATATSTSTVTTSGSETTATSTVSHDDRCVVADVVEKGGIEFGEDAVSRISVEECASGEAGSACWLTFRAARRGARVGALGNGGFFVFGCAWVRRALMARLWPIIRMPWLVRQGTLEKRGPFFPPTLLTKTASTDERVKVRVKQMVPK